MPDAFVSILMLTYNAPDYVRLSIESLRKLTPDVKYELVVVDNASDAPTVALVKELHAAGLIDKLVLNPTNALFAGGNNIAAANADPAATHFLLLNSDIEVRDPTWLRHLLDIHKSPGITAYGVVPSKPLRVDGYCLLIDATLYRDKRGLDEGHQWWWAVTKLQAEIISAGLHVQGYYDHDDRLIHFGGKSGTSFKGAKGMNVTRKEVIGWFGGRTPLVLDRGAMLRQRALQSILSVFRRRPRGS